MALMRLLSGERGYLEVDRDIRDTILLELESSNPDTSLFRAYADREISVSPSAVAQFEQSAGVRGGDDARIAPARPPVSEAPTPTAPRPVLRPSPSPAPSASLGATAPLSSRPRGGGLGIPPSPNAVPPIGMPLPPAPPPQARAMAATEPYFAPAPPVPAPAPRPAAPVTRLAPSTAPSTSTPAGTSTGLSGHGSNVSPAGAASARGAITNPPAHLMASSRRSTTAATLGGRCRYCSGTLPEGRQLTFCPHCGQDLTVQQCPACSTELELGWKFCTTCGRGVAQS